ncbi:MAG: restriction endonuclease subunit S [Burkholderiales bacterium]|nr:restriction endonuclease subunit S [Burkholderiales bacterium]
MDATKESEVGPIAADWSIVQLDTITDPERPISYGIVQTGPRIQNGIACLRVVDISDGQIRQDDLITTSFEIGNSYRRTTLRAGDLVVPLRGKVGECAQVPASLAGANLTRGVALVAVLPKHSAAYCKQFFSSARSTARLNGAMNGSALQEIPISTLRAFKIALPPSKPEQDAIAAALTDTDILIESLEQLLIKKRHIKQGSMQELLSGKRRLTDYAVEWSTDNLSALVQTPITDGPHSTPVFYDSGVPFLSVNNLINNRIDLSDLRYISREDDQLFSKKCKPRKNDILLGKAASVGKVALVESDLDLNIWSPIALIRAGARIAPQFLYYQLQSAETAAQITVLTNSSSQGNLGMGDIEKLRISYPEIEEQAAIAKVLSEMDAELVVLQARIAKARGLKQAMAQALLTGQIRLTELQAA